MPPELEPGRSVGVEVGSGWVGERLSTGRGVGVFVEVGSRVGVAVRVLSAALVAVAVRVGVLSTPPPEVDVGDAVSTSVAVGVGVSVGTAVGGAAWTSSVALSRKSWPEPIIVIRKCRNAEPAGAIAWLVAGLNPSVPNAKAPIVVVIGSKLSSRNRKSIRACALDGPDSWTLPDTLSPAWISSAACWMFAVAEPRVRDTADPETTRTVSSTIGMLAFQLLGSPPLQSSNPPLKPATGAAPAGGDIPAAASSNPAIPATQLGAMRANRASPGGTV